MMTARFTLTFYMFFALSVVLPATSAQAFESFDASQGEWHSDGLSENGMIHFIQLIGYGNFALISLFGTNGPCGGLLSLPDRGDYPLAGNTDLNFYPDVLGYGQGGVFENVGPMDEYHPCASFKDAQIMLTTGSEAEQIKLEVITAGGNDRIRLIQKANFITDNVAAFPDADIMGIKTGTSLADAKASLVAKGYATAREVSLDFVPSSPSSHIAVDWFKDMLNTSSEKEKPKADFTTFTKATISVVEDIPGLLLSGGDVVVIMSKDGTTAAIGRYTGIDPSAKDEIAIALSQKYTDAGTGTDKRGAYYGNARFDRMSQIIGGEALKGQRRDYQMRERPYVDCGPYTPFMMEWPMKDAPEEHLYLLRPDQTYWDCASELAYSVTWNPAGFHSKSVPFLKVSILSGRLLAPSDFEAFKGRAEPLLAEAYEKLASGAEPPSKVPDL